jgi:RPA family protein
MSSSQERQVAVRAFAEEFNNATHIFREGDDEMSPKFALLPTGQKANRVFTVGTVTETEDVGSDQEYWKARVVDPTGTFFVYAGQYQPEAASKLREIEPPKFLSIVGKPRTFETDDGDMNVTMRPEHVQLVDAETKTRWVVETANRTLDRISAFDADATADATAAHEQYGTDIQTYLGSVEKALESLTDD